MLLQTSKVKQIKQVFCKINLKVRVRCVIPQIVSLAMSWTSQMHGTIHLNLSIELYNQMTVCYSGKKKKKRRNRPWSHYLPRFTGASCRNPLYKASVLCVRILISIQCREPLPFTDRGSIFVFEVNPAPSCSNTWKPRCRHSAQTSF